MLTTITQLPLPRMAYSVSEAAAAFGRKPLWIYRKIYQGKLKICSPTGQIMIPAAELEKLVAKPHVYQPRKGRGRPKKALKQAAAFAAEDRETRRDKEVA
jgi:hypothetical protein